MSGIRINYLIMKLNVKKVETQRKVRGFSYSKIAELAGKKRQNIYDYIKHERVTGAKAFAKAFDMEERDFIIFD